MQAVGSPSYACTRPSNLWHLLQDDLQSSGDGWSTSTSRQSPGLSRILYLRFSSFNFQPLVVIGFMAAPCQSSKMLASPRVVEPSIQLQLIMKGKQTWERPLTIYCHRICTGGHQLGRCQSTECTWSWGSFQSPWPCSSETSSLGKANG